MDADVIQEAEIKDTAPKKLPQPEEEAATDAIAVSDEKLELKERATAEKEADDATEFLSGLQQESMEELGSAGGKPIVSREIDKKNAEAAYPENFAKFMAFCKQRLDAAGKGDMYRDTFHVYSVKNPAQLKGDTKKQEDIRVYLEALMEEEGVL
jgi:hypothetical protein